MVRELTVPKQPRFEVIACRRAARLFGIWNGAVRSDWSRSQRVASIDGAPRTWFIGATFGGSLHPPAQARKSYRGFVGLQKIRDNSPSGQRETFHSDERYPAGPGANSSVPKLPTSIATKVFLVVVKT